MYMYIIIIVKLRGTRSSAKLYFENVTIQCICEDKQNIFFSNEQRTQQLLIKSDFILQNQKAAWCSYQVFLWTSPQADQT